MDDPLGPILLSILLLIIAAFIHALNAVLPFADENELQEENTSGDQRILRLLNRYDNGYGELRLTYAFLLAAAFLFARASLSAPIAEWLHALPVVCDCLLLIVFSVLAFTFTAVIPDAVAAHVPQKALRRTSALGEWTLWLTAPVTKCAQLLGKLALSPFHIQPASSQEHVTEQEIRMMVDIGEEKGTIESEEKEMIENIFEFNNMDAEDCMVHRKDITGIDVEFTDAEVLETICESGLSRFPVYENNIDNIIGILTTRDYLINRCSSGSLALRALIRPAYFVPESVRTDVLFREMQTHKQHMAIVVDEYGGTSGLITLEDLLEEIVGNIYDEFDPKEEQEIVPLGDGRYRVSGATELETIAETFGADVPLDDEYDTLGGLIFSRMTEIPADGERPVVECFGLRISVEEIVDRRVEWTILERIPEHTEDEIKKG